MEGAGELPTASPLNSAGCPSDQYVAGESISLIPHPAPGQCVDVWVGTDAPDSGHLRMPDSDHTVMIRYRACTGARVRVGSGQVDPGESIQITVEALEMPGDGLGAFTIEILYDPAVVAVEACNDDPDGLYSGLCNDDGEKIRLTGASPTGVPGDSLLAEVVFRAVGLAGDSSVLGISLLTIADPEGQAIQAAAQDGLITLGAATGDVDCDGTTSAVDAMFILQREVGLRPVDSASCPLPDGGLYRPGCDVTRDGLCNVLDALLILQCEAGIANPLCPSTGATSIPGQKPTVGSATLIVDSGDVAPGETVVVRLRSNLEEAELAAATVAIQYDPDVLKPSACEEDPGRVFDLALCNAAKAAGEVGFTAISAAGVSGDVSMAEISFEAIGAEGDSSPLTLVADPFADPSGQALAVTIQNGQAEVREKGKHGIYLPLVLRE
jgi:hypothetical protein